MSADLLKQAFLQKDTNEKLVVKAEDLTYEGGVDFSKTFFEPKPGNSYTVKFIKNLEGENIIHRKVYKGLPDPTRKGKTFQFVSSGIAATCKALELFFELNKDKKAGDVLASQKIEEYLGNTNQGCCVIQIINSPEKEEIGNYRLMSFSNYGVNATIANLINEKLHPTSAQIDAGYEKEDIFNIFDSATLIIDCQAATYEGRAGRDFSKSSWSKKNRGAFVKLNEDGTQIHNFTEADIVDGDFTPDALKAFNILVEILQNPSLSIHNFFAYKAIGDPKNTEETEKYLKQVHEKVDEIIPVIKNAKNLDEIKKYGKEDTSSATGHNDNATVLGNQTAADILKESTPTELTGSVLNEGTQNNPEPVETSNAATDAAANPDGDIEKILNGDL